MALYSSIMVVSSEAAINGSQTTGGAHAPINIGKRRMFAINCDQDVYIAFGGAAMSDTSPTTGFRLPQNQTFVFDTGDDSGGYISIYNSSGSTVHYFIMYLSKF